MDDVQRMKYLWFIKKIGRWSPVSSTHGLFKFSKLVHPMDYYVHMV